MTVAALPVLALAALAATAQTAVPSRVPAPAAPGAVPGPPAGWTTQFSDDFNGSAGAGAGSQWQYDTGPGSSFGTGDTAAQVFIPQANGSLYNPQSSRCLDDTGWSATPGTQLQIWDCTGNANQKWSLP